jgi:2-hydroxy-3-keto-5-methylthiopentenyl-1-phosphate phosphatase
MVTPVPASGRLGSAWDPKGSDRTSRSPPRAPAFRLWLDFDGTLVQPNVAILLVEEFCPDGHRLAHEVDIALHEGRMTLREAWARQVALLPADRRQEMVRFVQEKVPLRPGASELLDFVRRAQIPTAIVSGGLDFFIRPLLEREGIDLPVFADSIRRSGPGGWEAIHPFGHPTCRLCGICKAQIVRPHGTEGPTVFVGDGSTDRYAAEVASVVFARARLKQYCLETGIPFFEFEDLNPVTQQLERWVTGKDPFPAPRRAGRGSSPCPISRDLAQAQD